MFFKNFIQQSCSPIINKMINEVLNGVTLKEQKLKDLNKIINNVEEVYAIKSLSDIFKSDEFNPNDYFRNITPYQPVLTNCLTKDIDGGVNEFLKIIFKTSSISQRNTENGIMSLITVMRTGEPQFWKCLYRSLCLNQKIFYSETSFFAGFASYFDKNTHSAAKKSLGFIIDDLSYYFDSRIESRLEQKLNRIKGLNKEENNRVRTIINFIIENKITKYNKYLGKEYSNLQDNIILLIDQKRNDASVSLGQATNSTFDKMLFSAIEENPGKKIYVKRHPDNIFEKKNEYKGIVEILPDDISIFQCLDCAEKVYTVSSQVGFEALLRNKHVVTFGLPFYSGWGLTDDRCHLSRRNNLISIEELFYVACIDMSVYVDPDISEITTLENTLDRILWLRKRFAL